MDIRAGLHCIPGIYLIWNLIDCGDYMFSFVISRNRVRKIW